MSEVIKAELRLLEDEEGKIILLRKAIQEGIDGGIAQDFDSDKFLHPNLKKITLRPWGAKEFAIKDKQVGVVIQEW